MPLSSGMRHARIALPISRQLVSTTSTSHSLRALSSSPLRSAIAHPRLYDRISALLERSLWKTEKDHESHTNRYHARSRDSNPSVLQLLDDTTAAVSGDSHRQLMDKFLARVDMLDPAPAQYSLRWLLRIFYERQPRRCFLLVMPDGPSRMAAREALQAVCKRWDGWVGALRSSYVCIVVKRDTFDNLREDLQYDSELDFKGEARVYCAVTRRYKMDPIATSSGLITYIEASEHNEGEACRLLYHSGANHEESIVVHHTVENRPSESTATSSNTKTFDSYGSSFTWLLKSVACCVVVVITGTACLTYLATEMTCGCKELCNGSDHGQEQHHGESHNRGESKQTSAPEGQHGAIQATGDVDASTHIHHGCEANPLSSSSPTVGNNQPNGNEGLTQK